MDKNYLLTYRFESSFSFKWFDKEKSLKLYIKKQKGDSFTVIDSLYISGFEEIN